MRLLLYQRLSELEKSLRSIKHPASLQKLSKAIPIHAHLLTLVIFSIAAFDCVDAAIPESTGTGHQSVEMAPFCCPGVNQAYTTLPIPLHLSDPT